MQNPLTDIGSYMSYYHTSLSLHGDSVHQGRASHVQVFPLPGEQVRPGFTHCIRFYDGRYHRELLGAATMEQGGETVVFDMGNGKVYRFVKQAARHLAD